MKQLKKDARRLILLKFLRNGKLILTACLHRMAYVPNNIMVYMIPYENIFEDEENENDTTDKDEIYT